MKADIGSIRRLFESQHGVIHRRQALTAGATRGAIQKKLARGEWVPVLPATYRLSGSPQTWHQRVMAACLWAGPGAVASHRTAAALLDLPGFKRGIIEITTSRRLSAAGIIVHRCRMNARIDNSTCDGIPTTAAHRTIIDLCAVSSQEGVERALDAVLVRGLSEVDFMWRQLNRWARSEGEVWAGFARCCRSAQRGFTMRAATPKPPFISF